MAKRDWTEVWRQVVGEPLGNKDLWERVKYWRERLKNTEEYPVLNGLESSWKVLDQHYGGIIERASDHKVSATPLDAFFYYIDSGFYPPPELLFALHDAYQMYQA